MTRRYSLPALAAIELAPPDLVSTAAAAGYDHVGLRLVPATPDDRVYPILGDTPLVRELETRLRNLGISVLDVEVFRLKPDTRLDAFVPAIETAARLGARHLLATGQDPDPQRLANTFAALCDLALPYGMTIDMEFMPWTEVASLRQAASVIAAADRPNGGVLLDALHFTRCGTTLAELAQLPTARVHYAQLCDAPLARPASTEAIIFEARCARLRPGEGELPLREFLQALPREVAISLEVPAAGPASTEPALERARRTLEAAKALVAAVDAGNHSVAPDGRGSR